MYLDILGKSLKFYNYETMTRSSILIIDGTNHLNRLLNSKPIYNSEFKEVGLVYRFIKFVVDVYNITIPDEIHLVFDVGRDLKKKKIFELYKSNRVLSGIKSEALGLLPEEMHRRLRESRDVLIKFFNLIPNVFVYPILAVEGDTIIAYITKLLLNNESNSEVIICSNDKDFYQLLDSDNIKILRYYKKQNEITFIDKRKAILDLGFLNETDGKILDYSLNQLKVSLSKSIPYYKAIIGDETDYIIGIKDLGLSFVRNLFKIQVIKGIQGFNSIDEFIKFLNDLHKNVSEKRFNNIDNTNLIKEYNEVLSNKRFVNKLIQFVKQMNDKSSNVYKQFEINYKLISFDYAISELSSVVISDIHSIIKSKKELLEKKEVSEIINKIEEYIYELELDSIEEFYYELINFIILLISNKKNSELVKINVSNNKINLSNWIKIIDYIKRQRLS